jgi:hypothetical protein
MIHSALWGVRADTGLGKFSCPRLCSGGGRGACGDNLRARCVACCMALGGMLAPMCSA